MLLYSFRGKSLYEQRLESLCADFVQVLMHFNGLDKRSIIIRNRYSFNIISIEGN
jgi:hypothetical protein